MYSVLFFGTACQNDTFIFIVYCTLRKDSLLFTSKLSLFHVRKQEEESVDSFAQAPCVQLFLHVRVSQLHHYDVQGWIQREGAGGAHPPLNRNSTLTHTPEV